MPTSSNEAVTASSESAGDTWLNSVFPLLFVVAAFAVAVVAVRVLFSEKDLNKE
jgi:hypothetical protein